MMRSLKYGLALCLCLVLVTVHVVPSFAQGWVLDDLYLEDDYPEVYLEDDSLGVASGSNASGSNAVRSSGSGDDGIMLLSSYNPYDNGSISSTVVNYMSDVVPKLGLVHYVLFRAGQYDYRLYYSKDMEYDGYGRFTAEQAEYISYDSRFYTWNYGSESDFGLSAGSVLVYSDLGGYPMLNSGETSTWLLAFLGAVYFLYIVVRSFLSRRKITI